MQAAVVAAGAREIEMLKAAVAATAAQRLSDEHGVALDDVDDAVQQQHHQEPTELERLRTEWAAAEKALADVCTNAWLDGCIGR